MFLNNIDISNYKAQLLTKDIQTAEVTTYDDWLRNALNPLYMGKQEKYKQIKIQLYIKDTDDNAVLNDISNIIKEFEKCTIKFDDIDFYYDCLIVNKNHTRLAKGKYTLDVELKSGYAYKEAITETMTDVLSKTVNVPGNLPTPAVVTITVPTNESNVVLSGFGEDDITINNVQGNMPVIIDGEVCTVTENGVNKFGDTDIWQFPDLQPGDNLIGINSNLYTVQIQYKPRWM
jgi:phage-related protein